VKNSIEKTDDLKNRKRTNS